jgi:hypothetical protein
MALSLLIYVGYREVTLRQLKIDIAAAEIEAANTKVASNQAVELFGKFKEQEKAILGLQQFFSTGKLVLSDFILHLGAMMPANIRLNSIDYKSTGVVLRGDIAGAAEEASGLAYTYLDVLRKDKDLSRLFDPITLNSVVLDPGVGRIKFEFGLKFKGGSTKKEGPQK